MAMAGAFLATFGFRVVTAKLGNDHFTHLSRARQILLGEWPIRDFFDPGQFLHYYVSAAGQVLFGPVLYGEVLVTSAFVALSVALTVGLGARLSNSLPCGIGAGLVSAMAFPRLYNYPKLVLYVGAIWLAWWYAHRPGRSRLFVLAAMTVVAFLFRYDHGIYIGLFSLLLLRLVHATGGGVWRRATATYTVFALLLVAPYLGYVQWATGLANYVDASLGPARVVRSTTIRAVGGQTESARRRAEAGTGVRVPAEPSDAPSRLALRAYRLVAQTLPWLSLGVAAWGWRHGRLGRPEGATIVAASCLCLVTTRTLVDNNPDARLADVTPAVAVLGAWLAGHALAAARRWPPSLRVPSFAALLSLFAIVGGSVATQAGFLTRVREAGIQDGPEGLWRTARGTYARLHLRPIDDWAPPDEREGIEALGRWVMRCTAPTDRLLVAGGFAPEIFYYAERGFAGGQVHFLTRWHETPREQAFTITLLDRQRVPVVLMGSEEAQFRRRFGEVAAYLDARYVEVPFAYGGPQGWRVLVRRQAPAAGIDAELSLPCFAPA